MRIPRSLRSMRGVVHLIHLAIAVVAGLLILVTTLSGTALVFRDEIDRALYPDLYQDTPGSLPLAQVTEAASRAYPDREVGPIYLLT